MQRVSGIDVGVVGVGCHNSIGCLVAIRVYYKQDLRSSSTHVIISGMSVCAGSRIPLKREII